MIIAFETEHTFALKNFIDSYIEPESMFAKLRHVYEYTHKSFKKIGNVYVFEFDSILNIIAKRSLIVSTSLFLMSYFLHWRAFSIIFVVIMLMSMFILSKSVKQLIFLIKIKRSGHKPKINFVSNDFLLNKFLSEVNNGTT